MLALTGFFGVYAQTLEHDLAITAHDISFIPSRIVVGQKVRIYASVKNNGSKDTLGYVSFYQGSILIGDSQPVSVRAGGFADEVFVDFIIPQGSFNIRADIRGQSPVDQNTSNDTALSPLFTPEPDKDTDGNPDAEDNCPAIANADQKDTDSDKLGDVCDDDIDGDGVPNAGEIKKGTNPLVADTDKDGALDGKDKFPLDAARGGSGGGSGSGGSSSSSGSSAAQGSIGGGAGGTTNTNFSGLQSAKSASIPISSSSTTITKSPLAVRGTKSRTVRMSSLIDTKAVASAPTFKALATEEAQRVKR